MSDLGRLRVWEDPAIRAALSCYLDVAENRLPAKFRIAATLATELNFALSAEKRFSTASVISGDNLEHS
jgi:putative pyruvate formate lyase activating enzyme